jgi:hypothetical protein
MGRNSRITCLSFLLALAIILSGTHLVQADNGDGSGGGQGQPLEIIDVIPADGASGVDVNLEQLKVTFSKNIAYMTIRENNRGCFSLWAGQEPVPVDIIIADDQIERDKRHEVVIKPQQRLQPGTTYSLKIAPQMESKSGVTLGREIILTFTTAGSSEKQTSDLSDKADTSAAVAVSEAVSKEAVKENAPAPTAQDSPDMPSEVIDPSPALQNDASPQPVETGTDVKKSSSWPVQLTAGIIAAVVILLWWVYRRQNHH